RSGPVELLGRRDRQVKLRGFRIEPGETERAVLATGRCSAVAVEKIGSGPEAFLARFVLPANGADAGKLAGALTGELRGRVPGYLIPARWIVLEALPHTPAGKLDRARLRELAAPRAADDGGPDGLGEQLRGIWREVLQLTDVGGGDNFLDLGGDSVLAV